MPLVLYHQQRMGSHCLRCGETWVLTQQRADDRRILLHPYISACFQKVILEWSLFAKPTSHEWGPHFLRAWLGSPPFGRCCSVEGVSRSSQRKVGTPSLSNLSQDVILFSGMNSQFQKKKKKIPGVNWTLPLLYFMEAKQADRTV